MLLADHLPGIIWSGFLGLVIGNFATSPIYRLPKGEPLFVEDPYCDTCHAKLTTRDLFPAISWIISRGKCRHCGARVPGSYTAIEIATGLLFILCYLKFGFSEPFLLVSWGMTSLLALGIMLSHHNFFSGKALLSCLICGALLRTLQEGTLYGFLGGGFTALLAGVLAWKLSGRALTRDVQAFPAFLKLLVVAGVWLHWPQLVAVFAAAGLSTIFRKTRPLLPEWTIISCTLLMVLFYPHWMLSL